MQAGSYLQVLLRFARLGYFMATCVLELGRDGENG